ARSPMRGALRDEHLRLRGVAEPAPGSRWMMINQIHVVPSPGGGWDIQKDGATRAALHKPTREEAVALARQLSWYQQVELVIYNEDGVIAEKESFSNGK